MKELLSKNDMRDFNKEYVNFVNVSRVINVYIIQLLCNKSIKLNMDGILKFLKYDSEIDTAETEITGLIVKYDQIKKNINTSKRIGIFTFFIFTIKYRCPRNAETISSKIKCLHYFLRGFSSLA